VVERSETTTSGAEGAGCGPHPTPTLVVADPEVLEKARRRQFSAAFKVRIVEEADACTEPGQVGELLRREGLYSSHLTTWRKQRLDGSLRSLSPKKRGRKTRPANPLASRVADLERENAGLRNRLRQAELIIDVQKRVSQILGVPLVATENTGNGS
jgi:transposase-like protein